MEGNQEKAYETTPVDTYDEEFKRALQEATEAQAAVKQKRIKTYLNSEIPVRPCTTSCPHRGTCKDFLNGRVADNELCKPELRQIKKWQVAFRKGDLEQLKDDVGSVAGSMAIQIGRLLEAVVHEGVVVETTKFTAGGIPYQEKMAHPALLAATKLAKDLGIDLSQFLMTPKSVKDAGPQVQVNIGISAEEVHARFAARFANKGDDNG